MPEIFDAETTVCFGSRHASMSLNLPTFIAFMRMADSWCEAITSKSGSVVHDETKEFRSAFDEAFRLLGRVGQQHRIHLATTLSRGAQLDDDERALAVSALGLQVTHRLSREDPRELFLDDYIAADDDLDPLYGIVFDAVRSRYSEHEALAQVAPGSGFAEVPGLMASAESHAGI